MSPRVLVAAPFPPPPTGQSLMTALSAEALEAAAHVTRLDTADHRVVWRRPGALPGRRVLRWTAMAAALRRAVSDADVVYITPASSLLGFLRDVLVVSMIPRRTPVVAHVHVGDYGEHLRRRGRPARRLAQRFDRTILPSVYAAEAVREVLPDADVRVVANTVRPGLRFTPGEVDAAWTARHAGRPVVLFLSNMIPSKGYGLLAEALTRLRHEVDAVFAGAWADPADRDRFETSLHDRGVQATVTGAVSADETRRLLERASVLAFPSTYPHESLPLAVLEAKAAGCAVVALDHAGVGEMVRDGVDGVLVPRPDAEAFGRALDAALDRAEPLGRAGAAHVRERFAPADFERQIVEAVLGRRSD